ncbi:MAG: arginine--tRNA ligase, partial [Acidimicrobiia bacterium]|nr:arginine--tRNA ligase [Acidimicrobiia bacterium]
MFPDAIVAAIRSALDAATAAGELGSVAVEIEVERPREREHGDWASNVSLAAAKDAGKAPREVAEIILRYLPDVPHL